jgi:hypothetical protein
MKWLKNLFKKRPVAEWELSCGRHVLTVNKYILVAEGDAIRDQDLERVARLIDRTGRYHAANPTTWTPQLIKWMVDEINEGRHDW